MKNLKKALATALALAVVASSGSALAAVTGTCNLTGDGATFNATYDANAKSLTAAVTGAKAGEQMTFLILDKDAETNATNDANGKSYQAADIVYIDQKEAAASNNSFVGPINLERITGATTDMPDGSYPVKFGYHKSNGDFALATGDLVIATVVDPAVQSITTDATADATVGTPLTITATVTAVGGASTDYTWTVTTNPGNAASVTGNSFVATKVGTYVVTAKANDDESKTATKTITVADSSPQLTSASIEGANAAYTDETVTLTGSYVDGGKSGVTLTWSISGNATLSTTTGATTVVTPNGAGDVTVTLKATSTTGVEKTATHAIAFSVRPSAPARRTITFRWGDIDGDNILALSDIFSVVRGSNNNYGSYTLSDSVNSCDVTVGDAVTVTDGETDVSVRWGDIDGDNILALSDIFSVVRGSNNNYDDCSIGGISTAVGSDLQLVVPAE